MQMLTIGFAGVQELEEILGGVQVAGMSLDDLHRAAKRGDVAETRRLVATGVGVNGVVADETTALHQAAADGHAEAVNTLVLRARGSMRRLLSERRRRTVRRATGPWRRCRRVRCS
jgi:hypothetical protein